MTAMDSGGDDALTVVMPRRANVEEQRDHLRRGACFVPLPDPPPGPFEELAVVLLAGGKSFETSARVVQILAPVGMALELTDPSAVERWLDETLTNWEHDDEGPLYAQWGRLDEAEREAPASNQPLEEPLDEAPPVDSDERELPLTERIQEMTTAEKMQLALHGDKTARTLLLKDPNKTIHAYIVRNKGITEDEIRYIAGYRQTNPDVLRQIGDTREWLKNPRILVALVTNPKTPATTATKLLTQLPPAELRRIAKSQSVPRVISAAARRLVVGD
jgi:hypothetical protein